MCKKIVLLMGALVLMVILPYAVCAESTQKFSVSAEAEDNGTVTPVENFSPSSDEIISGNETLNDKSEIKIRILVDNKEMIVLLHDNPTSRDFESLLPLPVRLDDYAGAEKISNLPRRLTTESAPPGSDPSVGDLAYYSPWGNIVLYYGDAGYADGLILLGKIESGVENLTTIQSDTPVNITKMN